MKTPAGPPSEVKSVGIWIRVSTEDQAKGESPEHHLARARAYATVKGWEVKEVYDLAGVSGKSVIDHTEAKRMLSDIRRGHITGLIFSKLARLARNTRELLDFADIFREQGADMISLQETIDTSTPAGRLFFTMIAAMAQWEREEIADRIKASISVRAKLGKPLGGPAPYGFRWQDKKLVLDQAESPIRKKAFELFAKHRRKGAVAKLLNDAGYRTRIGAKWSDIAIGRTLRCPSAKGVYYLNRTRQTGSWEWEEKPESEWGTLTIDPIVSDALWNECNQILEEQQKKDKRPGKRPVQVFAGITFCSCGQKMYVKANSPKYICQKCHNKIPVVDLEAICHDELKAYFAAPQSIAKHLAEANQNITEKQNLLLEHGNEIQKLRDEMASTHRLYLNGQITGQGFGQFYKPAEERLNQLLAELPKLEAEVDHLKVKALSTEEVVAEAEALYTRWPQLPVEDKRRIVQSIIEKIIIGKGEIDITFSHLPSSEDMVQNQQALRLRSAPVRPPLRSYQVVRPPSVRSRQPSRPQSAGRNSALPSSHRPARG
jgi:site-specific DNA recombinase